MHFTKMHGAGNDFIIVEDMACTLSDADISALAIRLCHRRMGIGADGLMLLRPAKADGDFAMLFYNSDGSLGEMCGNGARCIARYGYERGFSGEEGRIETSSGLVRGRRITDTLYRVRLNDPSVLMPHVNISVDGKDYDCAYVELGSPGLPHGLVIYDELDFAELDSLRNLGRTLRFAPVFPKGANFSFVKPLEDNRLMAVTFERGVEDFTLACGTGSGSIAAALTMRGLTDGRDLRVQMPGGELSISLSVTDGKVHDIFLTGPTCVVCQGETVEV